MLFSVVVPVYNVEKYLDECVQSIIQQVDSINNDCEILLIDDGSTDHSGKICDQYANKFPGIVRVFHKVNQGLLATRRYGFQRAIGEYIVNCDSDDLLEDKMLQSVKRVINKYQKPDVIIFNYFTYDGVKKEIAYENIFSDKKDCIVSKKDILHEYMCGHSIVSVWGKIIKRSCVDMDKDYSEYGRLSTGEDTLQSIEFFSNASTFIYLNEPLYDYRYGSGMTAKFDPNYYFSFKNIFEQIKKERWDLEDFNELFAIKVLQTAGRAITQSRYKKWSNLKGHVNYLYRIYEDDLVTDNLKYLGKVKDEIQYDHYILLNLLKKKNFFIIVFLLNIKNLIS